MMYISMCLRRLYWCKCKLHFLSLSIFMVLNVFSSNVIKCSCSLLFGDLGCQVVLSLVPSDFQIYIYTSWLLKYMETLFEPLLVYLWCVKNLKETSIRMTLYTFYLPVVVLVLPDLSDYRLVWLLVFEVACFLDYILK